MPDWLVAKTLDPVTTGVTGTSLSLHLSGEVPGLGRGGDGGEGLGEQVGDGGVGVVEIELVLSTRSGSGEVNTTISRELRPSHRRSVVQSVESILQISTRDGQLDLLSLPDHDGETQDKDGEASHSSAQTQ